MWLLMYVHFGLCASCALLDNFQLAFILTGMTSKNNNSGCVLGWLVNLIKASDEPSGDPADQTLSETQSPDTSVKELPAPNVMVSKKFFSAAEASFYRVLLQCLDDKTTILAQVSLQQLFYLKGPKRQQAWQNKIQSRSIDFLLCDTATLRPVLGIELDDASHKESNRVTRDIEVDRVFEAANLPLLHIPAQLQYDTRKLTQLIQDRLKQTSNVR